MKEINKKTKVITGLETVHTNHTKFTGLRDFYHQSVLNFRRYTLYTLGLIIFIFLLIC